MLYRIPVDIILHAESAEAAEISIKSFMGKVERIYGPQHNMDHYVFPVGYPIEEVSGTE